MIVRRLASLVVLALLVSGCSMTGQPDDGDSGLGGDLQANRWVLRSYQSAGALVTVPDAEYADAEFQASRIDGFGGCGTYSAAYRSGGPMLLVSMVAFASASCGEAIDTFQSTYLSLLGQSRFFDIRADALIIRGPDRVVLLEFDRAPDNPLLGSWVVESYATTPGTPIAPIAGTDLSVVFRLQRVGGSAGCNTFQGAYTTNGNLARIGPLASTQMACAENIMAQESAFLAALQGIARIEQRAQRVELTDLSGAVVVALTRPVPPPPLPSASPSAVPTASPTASPTPVPSPSATPAPTPSPTAVPTASPTAVPTATPTAVPTSTPTGSAAPTVAPPASEPPTTSCTLGTSTIVYPATWFTLPPPSTAACRYFSATAITTAPDPAAPLTGVLISLDAAATYADALTAATNATAWNVLTNQPVTISGLPATRIEATSTAGVLGYPVGSTRYGYLVNIGGRGYWLETGGTLGSPAFTTNVSVVDLMASKSTIVPPIPA